MINTKALAQTIGHLWIVIILQYGKTTSGIGLIGEKQCSNGNKLSDALRMTLFQTIWMRLLSQMMDLRKKLKFNPPFFPKILLTGSWGNWYI